MKVLKLFDVLVVLLLVTLALDGVSTYIGITSGVGHEANPRMAVILNLWPAATFVIQSLGGVAVIFGRKAMLRLMPESKKHSTFNWSVICFIMLLMVAFRFAVVFNNFYLLGVS